MTLATARFHRKKEPVLREDSERKLRTDRIYIGSGGGEGRISKQEKQCMQEEIVEMKCSVHGYTIQQTF